jgi:hypothetical protein
MPNLITIDFKTGKTMSIRDNVVLIGLPYEMRMEGKSKSLIDIVWRIESGELKPQKIDVSILSNEPGEIDKVRNKQNEAEEIQIEGAIPDNGNSTSIRNQQRCLQQIQAERNNRTTRSVEDREIDEDLENEFNELLDNSNGDILTATAWAMANPGMPSEAYLRYQEEVIRNRSNQRT